MSFIDYKEIEMAYCNKCGKPISDKYSLCYDCFSSGKTFINENGYRVFSDSGILVHRWVAQHKLGGELLSGEVVHHRDRDKLNNDPSNIWVFGCQVEHDKVHEIDGDFDDFDEEDDFQDVYDDEDEFEDDFDEDDDF